MAVPHLLTAGQRVLVSYGQEEDLLHERFLCAQVRGSRWIVCTPDDDIYLEDLAADVDAVYPLGPRGGVPLAALNHPLYRFGADRLGAARRADLLREGEELAAVERAAGPEPPPGDRPVVLPNAGGGGEAHRWIAFESRHGVARGAVVAGFLSSHVHGDRAVLELSAGNFIACAREMEAGAEPPRAPPGALPGVEDPKRVRVDDAADQELRTLPVRYSSDGTRFRDFFDAVSLLSETQFSDWGISGPRTTKWLLKELQRQRMTPTQRHHWWRHLLRLGALDACVAEHELISRVLEHVITYDQLNASELSSLELLSRRYQLIEERYAEELSAVEVSEGHDKDLHYEATLFMGAERSKGQALVCPALEEYIANKLKDESAVLKERRKGREERKLARGEVVPLPPAGSGSAGGAAASGQGGRGKK